MKILLTTDFTPAASNAIDYALNLFKNEDDVSYLLVHAYKSMVPYGQSPPAITVVNDDELKEKLEEQLHDIKEQLDEKVEIRSLFDTGTLPKVLESIIEEENPDLIVMGSREKKTFERMTLGSNVLQVASRIKRPVLAVPIEAEFEQLNSIVFATDLEPLEVQYDSLTMLKNLADKTKNKLDVVHVFEDQEQQEKSELKEKIEDSALHRYLWDVEHKHSIILNDSVNKGIITYLEDKKPDLLSVVPRDRNFIEKIFHNSLTEKMVYHSNVPLLLMV